jgi:hypothetical protein
MVFSSVIGKELAKCNRKRKKSERKNKNIKSGKKIRFVKVQIIPVSASFW